MAFVTQRTNGGWEVRESVRTEKGPRSRTLASFKELTEDVVQQAQSRASGQIEKAELLRAAARAGAPVAPSQADGAAIELFAALEAGEHPRPALWRLMSEHVPRSLEPLSADALPVGEWVTATPRHRGETLVDLLGLADALPQRRRSPRLGFPRLNSG